MEREVDICVSQAVNSNGRLYLRGEEIRSRNRSTHHYLTIQLNLIFFTLKITMHLAVSYNWIVVSASG